MAGEAIRKLMHIRPGEGRAVGFAFAYFFMLMSGYYLLRPLRDAMASGVVEDLFSFYAGTLAVMLLLTPLFAVLVSRVRKPLLLPIAYAFFASNLLVFYLLFKSMPDSRALAASFFVWVSVYNMFVVSVFWSFMADVFRDEEAKRLFGPIAAGGGTGAIVGPLVMQYLAPRIGVDAVVFLAMMLLLGTLPCIRALAHWAEARHGRFVPPPGDPAGRIGGGIFSGFMIVVRSRYLLGIVTIIALGSIAAAFMYSELLRVVGSTYPDLASRAQFFGRLDFVVNIAAWVFQAFVVSWLIRSFGIAGALVTMPMVALVSFLALAASPLLLVLAAGQVLRRGGEYGIAKPSREVLFTVVDAETKYKAKNFIDTVLQRGSDLLGIGLVTLAHAAGIGLVGYAVIGAALMIPAIAVSLNLGQAFERRQSGRS
jgi:AAA family ATP:ADP antiporter